MLATSKAAPAAAPTKSLLCHLAYGRRKAGSIARQSQGTPKMDDLRAPPGAGSAVLGRSD
jgi:hypothetical protein